MPRAAKIHRSKRKPAFDSLLFLSTESAGRKILKFRKGEVVFSQGGLSDSVFFVREGKVKITVVSTQGKEAVIAILGRHEFFGESCLSQQTFRLVTARALMDSNIMKLERDVMLKALKEQQELSKLFIAHLLTRAIRIEQDLADQLLNSSEKRLARALLLLANFDREGTAKKIAVKVSQETLAEMVGTTRSRVSHFMNKFRKLGLIEYNSDRLEVRNSLLQVVLTEGFANPILSE